MKMCPYCTYALWGISGIGIPLTVAVGGFWWSAKIIKKRDAEKWNTAKAWLNELRDYTASSDARVFWQLVEKSLYFPVSAHSISACDHNGEIVKRALENITQAGATKGLAAWHQFQEFMSEVVESGRPKFMDKKLETQLLAWIRDRC